jgi:hypothetical protein
MNLLLEKITHLIPDRLYIELRFRQRMHKKLELKNPKTYSEKLQWLKLHYHDPLQIKLVDKAEVKNWAAERIGQDHIIPTLGVWDSFDDINFDELPDAFVLKCTHDSGGNYFVPDKSKFNVEAARKKIESHLKTNYYWHTREWPYKYVRPRIIAESYLVDESGYELKDYKFFCFNGKVKYLFIATDRGVPDQETKFDFYDEDFLHLPIKNGHENADRILVCPPEFEEMKKYAAALSKGFPASRIDFYDVDGNVYFGEITFFHWGGMMPFEPEEWDRIFGDQIILPEIIK